MRQMAELGFAVVSWNYDEDNTNQFYQEIQSVLGFIHRQSWADTNKIGWLGYSLGARRMLSFMLTHPNHSPRLMVQIAGGWVNELDQLLMPQKFLDKRFQAASASHPWTHTSILLVHGEFDGVFPLEDIRRLDALLQTNSISVDKRIIAGADHGFGDDKAIIFRSVAEYCSERFVPSSRLYLHEIPSYWFCWLPAIAWGLIWGYAVLLRWRNWVGILPIPSTRFERGLRMVTWIAACMAIIAIIFYFGWPNLNASPTAIQVARDWISSPSARAEVAYLSDLNIWKSHSVCTVLEHAELPNFRGPYLYQNLEISIFQDYIVSPVIDDISLDELNWRRLLWENFYPRVRNETTPVSAAQVVVRFLRERVSIHPYYIQNTGIETIWREQVTNAAGWERIYVAALRSAGVAARLNGHHQAEIWTGFEWQLAPRPTIETMLPLQTVDKN